MKVKRLFEDYDVGRGNRVEREDAGLLMGIYDGKRTGVLTLVRHYSEGYDLLVNLEGLDVLLGVELGRCRSLVPADQVYVLGGFPARHFVRTDTVYNLAERPHALPSERNTLTEFQRGIYAEFGENGSDVTFWRTPFVRVINRHFVVQPASGLRRIGMAFVDLVGGSPYRDTDVRLPSKWYVDLRSLCDSVLVEGKSAVEAEGLLLKSLLSRYANDLVLFPDSSLMSDGADFCMERSDRPSRFWVSLENLESLLEDAGRPSGVDLDVVFGVVRDMALLLCADENKDQLGRCPKEPVTGILGDSGKVSLPNGIKLERSVEFTLDALTDLIFDRLGIEKPQNIRKSWSEDGDDSRLKLTWNEESSR